MLEVASMIDTPSHIGDATGNSVIPPAAFTAANSRKTNTSATKVVRTSKPRRSIFQRRGMMNAFVRYSQRLRRYRYLSCQSMSTYNNARQR
jgi:hypothetical protein